MAEHDVIDFAGEPLRTSRRRLADLPDRVVEGDPQHETRLMFESPDGAMIAGIWTSTPGKWHAFTERDEYCYILEGHCRLIDEEGNAKTFRKDDAFLIPNGFRGYWEIIETTTKHFVIRQHNID